MSVDSAAAQPATPDSLIERCLIGDQAAWETVVRQNWRKVFNVAYKFVGKHDEAEDLTQDIFLKIFKALATFDRRANFQTWIISISRNLCIDHYRSVRKERQTIAREVDAGDLQPVSSDRGPYAAAEHQDLRVLLRQALQMLPVHAADRRRAARPAGALVSGNRRPAGAAGRHREIAHQPRPSRAGAAAQTVAGQTAGAAQTARRAFESARPAAGSIVMNLTTEHANGIAVVRVGEARLMYPLLSEFSSAVTQLIAAGERRVVVDLSAVGYVDSATIGCLMDLYRQASAAGGALKLAGVQKRVETMLTMTGAQNFIEVHPDEPSAVKSFGA